ncbi:MAG: hypothetical protein ACJ71H_08710, partial [Nitrososphaeraceae archaeon]
MSQAEQKILQKLKYYAFFIFNIMLKTNVICMIAAITVLALAAPTQVSIITTANAQNMTTTTT